ncbi:transglycosylase SLT domain-containing protein [Halioxenophilus sp. WMMB6]|uniref:transglycosylase SLT domain-containing protein n=1 Tax=Halioxenophilus sp. WMMB6 TaxID=3073815 RepID=UPI00295EC955|nr:transglycosylase SLT domain-containing protein [Halioxenophilus sp. WMMB6]
MRRLQLQQPGRKGKNLAINVAAGLSLLIASLGTTANTEAVEQTSLETQRELYSSIRGQLSTRAINLDEIPYDQLADYPLIPYLQFQHLNASLNTLPYQEVDAFLDENANSWLADRLLKSWLEVLASKRRWHEFQSYYQPNVADTGLHCLYLMARSNNGDPEALNDVATLWNEGKSLPKRCDALFAAWLDSDYFTSDVAWSRYVKSIGNRKLALAHYVRGLMDEKHQALADTMLELYNYPSRLHRLQGSLDTSAEMQEIIHFGVRRYAKYDSVAALHEWEKFDSALLLEQEQRNETVEYLAYQLILDGHPNTANRLLERNQIVSSRVTERQLRDALKVQDWSAVIALISQLPADEQISERWRYWSIRAIEEQKLQTPEQIAQQYRELANHRDFYGFLSAERTESPYTMGHRAVESSAEEIQAVENIPALERSRELFKLGYLNQARMEWRYGTQLLDHAQLLAAGQLANSWGWHRKTIESLGQAKYWDDLDLRFPVIYSQEVATASEASSVAPEYILAIARQESAFAADARSPAGAMGLMQLMPTTALQTAKKIGVRYNKSDLLQPKQNLLLGGSYLSQMLERFGGNRILATAAYNAGPHRVDSWLNPVGKQVAYDIWIETIPFKETRGYVQNVLTYSLIYSHRLGIDSKLLQVSEMEEPL